MAMRLSQHADRLTRTVYVNKRKIMDIAFETYDSFFEHIFRHCGLADNILSDCDTKFHSTFWRRLMERSGIQLNITMS